MNKHVVKPTSVIDWSTSVVGGASERRAQTDDGSGGALDAARTLSMPVSRPYPLEDVDCYDGDLYPTVARIEPGRQPVRRPDAAPRARPARARAAARRSGRRWSRRPCAGCRETTTC